MRTLIVSSLLLAAGSFGQSYQRQATITGGGSDQGRCTVEVQVDNSAEVQIRGTAGVLTNVSGQAPQWRRFECTAPMPLNPNNFRYSATGGRGQQQLVRDPSSTGVAIVRLEDSSGGADLYAFTFEWQGYSGNPGPFGNPQGGQDGNPSIFDGQGDDTRNNNGKGKGKGKGKGISMSSAEAIEACQQQIMREAMQRFNTGNIYFRRTTVDNNRGGRNEVRGTIDVAGNNQSQRYRFDCSVNLNNGRVQSARIDNSPAGQNTRDYGYSGGNYDNMGVSNANRAIQACETAVDRRLSDEGLQRVGFGSIDIDDRSDSSRVFGSTTVSDRSQRQQTVDFSCSMNLQKGTVNSVDVIRRRY